MYYLFCWTQTSCSTRKRRKSTKEVSRSHKIVSETGLITITGGNGQLTEKLPKTHDKAITVRHFTQKNVKQNIYPFTET
jgi:glycerol-3-phosphate dehydrogenase